MSTLSGLLKIVTAKLDRNVLKALQFLATAIDTGGGGGLPVQPFLGETGVLWSRPALDISGPSSTFNSWLNRGAAFTTGIGNMNGLNEGGPVAIGSGYDIGDTVTLAGGAHSVAAVLTLSETQVATATIVSAGTGGTPGKATVIGTTGTSGGAGLGRFVLNVTIGGGGTISSIDGFASRGDYTVNPADIANEPVADNSSSGLTGAVLAVTMGAFSATVTTPGTYTVAPTNPVSQSGTSGAGTGATWMIYMTVKNAVATDGSSGAPLTIVADCIGNQSIHLMPTALLKPVPGASYTVTCAVANAGNVTAVLPLVLYDSTAKKATAVWWSFGQIQLIDYEDVTPGSSPIHVPFLVANIPRDYFMWFRVENDGTDLIFSMSLENVVFIEMFRRPGDAISADYDFIGFGIERVYSGPGSVLAALWNWVES